MHLADLSSLASQLTGVAERKHMMIVADLENGNPDAVEDAMVGAWELQSGR